MVVGLNLAMSCWAGEGHSFTKPSNQSGTDTCASPVLLVTGNRSWRGGKFSLSSLSIFWVKLLFWKKERHTLGKMCKKQSTNFIILSLQRHKPLYPQNISLEKKKHNKKNNKIAFWWPYTRTGRTEKVQRTDEWKGRSGSSEMWKEARDIDNR